MDPPQNIGYLIASPFTKWKDSRPTEKFESYHKTATTVAENFFKLFSPKTVDVVTMLEIEEETVPKK